MTCAGWPDSLRRWAAYRLVRAADRLHNPHHEDAIEVTVNGQEALVVNVIGSDLLAQDAAVCHHSRYRMECLLPVDHDGIHRYE